MTIFFYFTIQMSKSKLNWCIILITLVISFAFFIKHGKESYTFYGDALGYYTYLPSAFIYHNFKAIEWLPKDKQIEQPILDYVERYKTEGKRSPKGYYINQYTYGIALTELPFFCIAHAYEKVKGLPANGYSTTYHYLIKFATIFYTFLGLFFLYKSLNTFFDKTVSLFTTSLILIGTNVFWLAFFQSGMAHIPLFSLYSLLIYITIKIHDKPGSFKFILLGLICGFITIIRPSDIVCILIPLLYNVYNKNSLQVKLKFIQQNFSGILFAVSAFFIPIVPQLLFWKKFTGQYLYNSYGEQSFNWLDPQIFKGLFGFSNGWLPYTPLMILSILGILFYKKIKPFIVVLLTILPIYIYIIYSWYCYNYINGFGSRPMIHLYPLLAFPLSTFLLFCFMKNNLIKVFSFLIISVLALINISYSYQIVRGDLISENANYKFVKNTMFRTKIKYKDLVLLDIDENQPEDDKIKSALVVDSRSFEDREEKYYCIKDEEEFPDLNVITQFNNSSFKDADYIKCSGMFHAPVLVDDPYKNQLFVLEIKHKGGVTLPFSGKL